MSVGGGKYEKEVVELLERLHADGVMLIVVNGDRGHGIALRGNVAGVAVLPAFLRKVASDLESPFSEAWKNARVDEPSKP